MKIGKWHYITIVYLFLIMQFTYDYTFTKEDYIEYYMYTTCNSPERKKLWRKYYIKNIFLVLLLAVFVFFSLPSFSLQYVMPLCVGIIVMLIGIFNVKEKHKKVALQTVENKDNENMFGKMQLTFNNECITLQMLFINVAYKWKAIIKKEETKDFIYFFINDMQAIIFPKKYLTSIEEEKKLKEFIASKTSFEADFG